MRIEILSMMYNEAFLTPLFLRHYAFADRITVLLDQDTTDDTARILRAGGATIIPFRFPDGMDDSLKIEAINAEYWKSKADWVLLVDADEFVRCPDERQLGKETADILPVAFWEVFRHQTDADVDITRPPYTQRRHGNPVRGQSYGLGGFTKPIVARRGLPIVWGPGCHEFFGSAEVSPVPLEGVHWGMADPCFCVTRRCRDRRDRQSQHNLAHQMTIQHHHITEAEVLAECERHLQDPPLF